MKFLWFNKIILSCILLFFFNNSFSQNNLVDSLFSIRGEQYFSFDPPKNVNTVSKFISIDHKTNSHKVYAYANKKEFLDFLDLNIPFEIINDEIQLVDPTASRSLWNFYPNYQEYETMMQAFADSFPSICKLHNLGTLNSGHKILAVQISNNVGFQENEPSFLYTSSMHGNELTGYVLMLRLIDEILNGYSLANYTNIVDGVDLWINPLANPDGAFAVSDLSVNGAVRGNANWIDLNRNYPDPLDGDHPDGNSWQEETVIFMNLADSIPFSMSCNFHTGAEVFNYPWDTWSNLTADDSWWQNIGSMYADTVHQHSASGYFNDLNNGLTNGWVWYEVDGGRQDFMNYYKLCRESTIELSSTKVPTPSTLPNYWTANKASLFNYIEESLNGLRGLVSDTITGQPLSARVEIFGHDYDSSHVYSNLPIGNYHRYLSPGNYLVNFSSQGYESKSINVDIYNATATVLNVQLGAINTVGIIESEKGKKLVKKVDLLGREGSDNSVQIEIFDDGSTRKIINNKNK